MSETIDAISTLEVHSCAECGVQFALPARIVQDRRQKDGYFFCPNGHSLTFHNTEVKKLREHNKQLRAQLIAERDQHAALKGELRRQKKRSAAGVCPCCRRSFQQLRRHMANKHPDYADE